jgi:small subunit ribosomal protein S15
LPKACVIINLMLTQTKKARTIKTARIHDTDTGSAEVQIALLSKQIEELTSHLKKHAKDKHGRRGLLAMVADRRSHLKYLEKKDKKRHAVIVKKLGL